VVYDLKVSVVGSGAQGSAIALILSKNPAVSEIISADINLNASKKAAEKTKSDRVSAKKVDASSVDDLVRVVDGSDTVVNATLPRFNPNIMEAALRSGTNYVDLAGYGSIKDTIPKVLGLNDKFKDAGLTAVIHQGGPFTTNAAVKYVADKLDRVDDIRMRYATDKYVPIKEFIPTWAPSWSPETALSEWVPPAAIYEDGRWKYVPPFSGVEDYLFPEPVGPATVCNIDYEPTHTLPRFIKGVKYVDYKIRPDRMAGSLIKIGFGSDKPVDVKDVKVAPIDVLLALVPPAVETQLQIREKVYGCSLAEVKGEKAGKKITYTVFRIFNLSEDYERWGTKWAGVAVPAALTATMLAKGEIKTKGVVPPEGLDPELFLARLAEMGWIYHERITREIRW
jgi:saccharopine dehydrogenase (NAD+, L-lysine-forming)